MAVSPIRIDIPARRDELQTLENIRSLFEERAAEGRHPQLVGDGGTVTVPESLLRVLQEVVPLLLEGKSVSIIASDEELTTQQAADILNVSRQHVVNLITAGEFPAHKAGTHRRIALQDLLEYRDRQRASQEAALDELARLSLEEGMYDSH
jgi:excisionase family DNA binding protein